MKWIECDCCGAEFRVVSDVGDDVCFCPFCGDNVQTHDEDDEYEDE